MLSTIPLSRWAVGAALALSQIVGSAGAASSVYRCTNPKGEVTLSDRRCPDEDAKSKSSKAETPKDSASAPQPAATKLDAKACEVLIGQIGEARKTPRSTDAERRALRKLEVEQQQRCT